MTFALFRVAAGPRIGHGHLRRAEVLARALGRSSAVSIRGAGAPHARLPLVPLAGPGATLDAVRPRVLVLDDPIARASRPWSTAARRRGVPVVSVHDLGLAPVPSDLAVNGSIVDQRPLPAPHVLDGLSHAVIAPPVSRRRSRHVRRVLISLGGGPRVALVKRIAASIGRRWPALEIVATGGRVGDDAARGFSWVAAPAGLAPWLARVDAAVVAGGISLYEAVAAGVPTIGLAVVRAQRPTIRAFAARRLALDAGLAGQGGGGDAAAVCRAMGTLLQDVGWRAAVARDGTRAIDGRGARRVARAILALANGVTHA